MDWKNSTIWGGQLGEQFLPDQLYMEPAGIAEHERLFDDRTLPRAPTDQKTGLRIGF